MSVMAAAQSTAWVIFSHVLLILPLVTPQEKIALSFNVTTTDTNCSTYFNFQTDHFVRFYNCLCRESNTDICKAHNNPFVTNVTWCSKEGNNSLIPFICQKHNKDLVCERRPASDNLTLNCMSDMMLFNFKGRKCLHAPIKWDSSQNITVHNYSPINITSLCENNCKTVNLYLHSSTRTTTATTTTSSSTTTTTRTSSTLTSLSTATTTTSSPTAKSPVSDTTSFPITSRQTNTTSTASANTATVLTNANTTLESISSVWTNAPASEKTTDLPTKAVSGNEEEGKDGNETILIISFSVGVAVVAVIIVIIVIIFWRRRMKQSSSSTNKSNDTDDETDINPYGPSTLDNIKPKENKNKDKRTINGQGLSSDPASNSTPGGFENAKASIDAQYAMVDLSAKRKNQAMGAYPNPYEEASPDIANQYTLVDLSSKNKPKSISNFANSSSYEKAHPDTAVQYSTVDLSAKNKPKPANDVYAKLHDPVRNITNVYNQLPTTDNAGE